MGHRFVVFCDVCQREQSVGATTLRVVLSCEGEESSCVRHVCMECAVTTTLAVLAKRAGTIP